LRAEVR
jgi:hypothetical protein